MTSPTSCRICGGTNLDPPVTMREMMFGTREPFDYFRCQSCDTMQIMHIPDDIGRFYPDNYYSFTPTRPTLRDKLRVLIKGHNKPDWAKNLSTNVSVIDIGCGGGEMLYSMHGWGFRKLTGYDPYTRNEIDDGRIRIVRTMPSERYDLVTMHHSIEHVPDPIATLEQAKAAMMPNGTIIVRIPVRQGAPWRDYGTNWVHADPPRHLYLWTADGFVEMARKSGLVLIATGFDTTLFTFAGSESYVKGSPLYDSDGNWQLPQDREQDARAEALNANRDADSAWFKFAFAPDHPTSSARS
jgi:SAM-dependent methyltransferase